MSKMTAGEAINTIHTYGYAAGRSITLHAGDKATRNRAVAAIREAFDERDKLRELVAYYQQCNVANAEEEAFQRGEDDR